MSVSHSERNLGIKRGEIFESWELKALKACTIYCHVISELLGRGKVWSGRWWRANRHLIVGCFTSAVIIVTASRVKFRMESNQTWKLHMKVNVVTSYKDGDSVVLQKVSGKFKMLQLWSNEVYGSPCKENCLIVYRQFNIQQFYVLPTQLYLCFLCGSQNKQPLFPYTALTDWLL